MQQSEKNLVSEGRKNGRNVKMREEGEVRGSFERTKWSGNIAEAQTAEEEGYPCVDGFLK
jgi:hypothetical protein